MPLPSIWGNSTYEIFCRIIFHIYYSINDKRYAIVYVIFYIFLFAKNLLSIKTHIAEEKKEVLWQKLRQVKLFLLVVNIDPLVLKTNLPLLKGKKLRQQLMVLQVLC